MKKSVELSLPECKEALKRFIKGYNEALETQGCEERKVTPSNGNNMGMLAAEGMTRAVEAFKQYQRAELKKGSQV